MRFDRQPRYGARSLTERQRTMYARKLAKELARYPLFPDHVANEQRSVDDEAMRREVLAARSEQDRRDFLASVWRRARAIYFAQPADARKRIRAKWLTWTGPCTAIYFAYLVDVESGAQALRVSAADRAYAPLRERIQRQLDAERAAVLDV